MQPEDNGGGPGDALGGVADSASKGLSTAKEKAGDVLEGIFGGLPWEMSASDIVDAVTGTLVSGVTELALVPYYTTEFVLGVMPV